MMLLKALSNPFLDPVNGPETVPDLPGRTPTCRRWLPRDWPSYLKLEDHLIEAQDKTLLHPIPQNLSEEVRYSVSAFLSRHPQVFLGKIRDAAPSAVSVAFSALVAVYLFRGLLTTKWRGMARRMINLVTGATPKYIHNYARLRKAFNETEIHDVKKFAAHSHGSAAAERSSARNFIKSVCTFVGLDYFAYQMSAEESRSSTRGVRDMYWAKDTAAVVRDDAIHDSDVTTMIDVDYYTDLPDLLGEVPRPTILFTKTPSRAARICDDYAYTFNALGELVWSVTGGAKYTHQLWNFGTDWFTTSRTFCGIPYQTTVWDVQSRVCGEDSSLILLSPIKVHYGLAAVFVATMGRRLQRRVISRRGFAKVTTMGSKKLVSVAKCDSHAAATIELETFDAARSVKSNSPKEKLQVYQIKSLLPKGDKAHTDAQILVDFFNNTNNEIPCEFQPINQPSVVALSFTPYVEPLEKPSLVPFCRPFATTAMAHTKDPATANAAVITRVEAVRAKVEKMDLKMTSNKEQTLAHFIDWVVGDNRHKIVPIDFDDLASRQTRPGQKRDLETASFMSRVRNVVQSFMKPEAFQEVKDPRNITTFDPLKKLDYAQYMYALMDAVKGKPYYAFGLKPVEVARRVVEIAEDNDYVHGPDITRMDGHVNELSRSAERALGLAFLAPEYHEDFLRCHEEAYGNDGYTADGMRYDQGWSRGSGELGTSFWNTFLNLLVIFYSFRLLGYMWKDICSCMNTKVIAGGDDSLISGKGDAKSVERTAEALTRAGREWGFTYTNETFFQKTRDPITFLARFYGPDVWVGAPDSTCDMRRQLTKFHLTPNLPLSNEEKFMEKITSFNLTDRNTPVFRALITRALELRSSYVSTRTLTRWGDQWDHDVQYPNEPGDWMDGLAEKELEGLNVPEMEQRITACRSIEELLDFDNEKGPQTESRAPEGFTEDFDRITRDEELERPSVPIPHTPLPEWFASNPGTSIQLSNHFADAHIRKVADEGTYAAYRSHLRKVLDRAQPDTECVDRKAWIEHMKVVAEGTRFVNGTYDRVVLRPFLAKAPT